MDAFAESLAQILASPAFTQAVASVFLMVMTGVIAFVGTRVRLWFDRRLSADDRAALNEIAMEAVQFAQQTGLDTELAKKKQEALEYASRALIAAGIDVSAKQLDAAIEVAVFRMKQVGA